MLAGGWLGAQQSAFHQDVLQISLDMRQAKKANVALVQQKPRLDSRQPSAFCLPDASAN